MIAKSSNTTAVSSTNTASGQIGRVGKSFDLAAEGLERGLIDLMLCDGAREVDRLARKMGQLALRDRRRNGTGQSKNRRGHLVSG